MTLLPPYDERNDGGFFVSNASVMRSCFGSSASTICTFSALFLAQHPFAAIECANYWNNAIGAPLLALPEWMELRRERA